MLRNKKRVPNIIIIAILIKLSLFIYTSIFYPQGKFQPDSLDYLNTGTQLVSRGVFAQDYNGVLIYESRRTPGYPLFLGVLRATMKITLEGVILIQVLLTILAALIIYKAAFEIDNKIAFLSGAIVLYSPTITIFSLQILTESLYLFLISLFMLTFIRYLKNRKIKLVILSAILLVLATYVRPISYYLCGLMAIFIVYVNIRDRFWKAIFHAAVFLLLAYALLGIWQLRNHIRFHQNIFTHFQNTVKNYSLLHSYATNNDPFSKRIAPIPYYINVITRGFLSLMTEPGSLKYFHCYTLTAIGKVFGYAFVAFWWIGLLVGLIKIKRNVYYQFALFIILYFIFVTITTAALNSGPRLRVPIVPFIAVISAAGWIKLKDASNARLECYKKTSSKRKRQFN